MAGRGSLLGLLLLIATDRANCQRPVSLGRQQLPGCALPGQDLIRQSEVGTNFSATCTPECIKNALAANQQQDNRDTVFGTRVYSLDSDLCLAAVHDARLPQPQRLTGPADVLMTLVHYDRPMVASFRRGVSSAGRTRQTGGRGLLFTSDWVDEAVPDITTVHTNFRRDKTGKAYIRCHAGPSTDLSDLEIYRISGGTGHSLPSGRSDDFISTTHERDKYSPAEGFMCRAKTSSYSDTTTFAYSGAPYHEPGQKNYWANDGDYVTMTSSLYGAWHSSATWFDKGFSGTGQNVQNLNLYQVKPEQSGIYLLAYDQTDRRYSSATRLVVRACPEGLYGAGCTRRCPHCLHGGRCHEATGRCICPPGFKGHQCEEGCGESRFGASCSSVCPRDDCSGRLLCVPDPYGCSCAPGWRGNDCTQSCPQGTYGPDCAFLCGHCKQGRCDMFTGHCAEGCSRNDVTPPLCTKSQWQWFREAPQLQTAGVTSITVRQRRWDPLYDNGFNPSVLQYRGQTRLMDSVLPWTPAATALRDDTLHENDHFTLELRGLLPDTRYLIRIIIEDVTLNAKQDSDTLVPVLDATTNCEAPGAVSDIFDVITDTAASLTITDISNRERVCRFQYNVTLTAMSPGAVGSTTRLVGPSAPAPVQFTNLTPYSEYILQVIAVNRKGSSPPRTKAFRTAEGAPSKVANLAHNQLLDGNFSIAWDVPEAPNGIIRHYEVFIKHVSYTACSSGESDSSDVIRTNITELFLDVPLLHGFSEYAVTVTAFTVLPGEAARLTIHTPRTVPKSKVDVSAVGEERSAMLSWTWPHCSMRGDDYNNLRLLVTVRGKSPWNQAMKQENVTYTSGSYIRDLVPFSNYSLRVAFCNSVGCSETTQDLDLETRESDPGAPENVTAVGVSPSSVTVGWDPPSPPLSRIASYSVYGVGYYDDLLLTVSASEACSSDSGVRPRCRARVTGLREDTEYTLLVVANSPAGGSGARSRTVKLQTGEGVPGVPQELQLVGRSQTMLNISWLEPLEKNGRLLQFQLEVSETEPGRRRRQIPVARTFTIPARQRDGRTSDDRTPYTQLVDGLAAGRRYMVRVSASTAAGRGASTERTLETLVAAPLLAGRPRVVSDSTTDTSVLLHLPAVRSAGGPLSGYLVLVSTVSDLNVSQLQPAGLRGVQESEQAGLDYYVTAALQPERLSRDDTFVVGDGLYYNSTEAAYLNRPLATGATYWFGVAAVSRLSEDNQQLAFQSLGAPVVVLRPPASPVLPVLLVLLGLLLVLGAVGAVVYRKRIGQLLFKNTAEPDAAIPLEARKPEELELDNEDMEDEEAIYENMQPNQINMTRIEVGELSERTRADAASGQLMVQLQSMPHGLVKPCTRGSLPENRRKNRYANMLPYDESRVVLEKMTGDDFSDYINANYIQGYNRARAYIACQGPKRETTSDFWRMVWQEGVVRIVMVTNLVESGKRKCDQYWPGGQPLRLPGLTLQLDTERELSDFTVRQLSITKGAETREVTQFHYTAWPDHSVPTYPSSLAKFIRIVSEVSDYDAPTVVHCSAGVGRTGTVILIDAMYQMARAERAVDVCSHLAVIRQQRANLCANLAQYQLVHQVLVELLVAPLAAVPAAQLAARLPQLRAPAAGGGPSQLELQVRHLQEHLPAATYATLSGLQLEGKNRSPHVLPEDSSRVLLDPKMPDNYINAVFVQDYRRQDAFIVTEAPLPARKYIFWQMVVQKHSRIIVVMHELEKEDVFWPTEGQSDVYRDIEVQSKGETISGGVITVNLHVVSFESIQVTGTTDVTVLVLAGAGYGGGGAARSPGAPALLQLYSAYMRAAAPLGALPAVVVCRDGVCRCGLFVTVCFELEHLNEEQELDVMMAVSAVRRSRPQFITGMDQYQLCYDVAVSWLETFTTYANFQ